MKTSEVRLLLKLGLINPHLESNYSNLQLTVYQRIGESIDDNYKFGRRCLVIGIIFALVGLTLGSFMSYKTLDSPFVLFSSILSLACLFLAWATTVSQFGEDLTYLDEIFRKYTGHPDYILYYSFEKIGGIAEDILHKLANDLRLNEEMGGLETPESMEARRLFKKTHKIFMKFGLCDGNQGRYLPKERRQRKVGAFSS
jgi:hypothetical protein